MAYLVNSAFELLKRSVVFSPKSTSTTMCWKNKQSKTKHRKKGKTETITQLTLKNDVDSDYKAD